jgi:hypothetical protein
MRHYYKSTRPSPALAGTLDYMKKIESCIAYKKCHKSGF